MRSLGALLCTLALAALAAPAAAPGPARPPDLSAALDRALRAPGLDPRRTGALAVDLRTGAVVFARNAGLPLAPASAEKLAVSFAALRLLGPGYRLRTEVAGSGRREGATWLGDLYLVGGGDPTLAERDLRGLARGVAAWGIRRVRGAVRGDERRFDAARAGRGWKPWFSGVECAPLSALIVQGVRVPGTNASAAAAARAFRLALRRQGMAVEGGAGTGRAPTAAVPLALDLSPALSALVRRVNRESDNLAAELLLKELGAALAGRGTSAAGAAVVRRELARAGVPLRGVRLVDGSGLSTLDRLTARALVGLLLAADRDPALRAVFRRSLAVAGVSGTLERRLEQRPTRGRVLAKTGTTSGASALAGFVGTRYAFAVLQNGSPVPYWAARTAQDRFVTLLARA